MSQDLIRVFQETSVRELVDRLGNLSAAAASFEADLVPPVVYRGHSNAKWHLVPSFWREVMEPRRRAYLEAWRTNQQVGLGQPQWSPPSSWPSEQRDVWAGVALSAMQSQLKRFMQHALVAKQLVGVAAVEASLALNHRGADRAYVDPTRMTIIGLAQHHGIPTPLLDWTIQFQVALWFIVDDVIRENRKRRLAGKPRLPLEQIAEVWGFPRSTLSSSRIELKIVIDQSYPTAQGGMFTLDHGAQGDFQGYGVVTPVDVQAVNARTVGLWTPRHQRPFRVQFPLRLVPELRTRLRGLGYTTATLKPTLDNIARFVRNPGMA